MRRSSIPAKAIVALATAALIAGGASGAPNPDNGKWADYKLDTDNPEAEKQCIDKGASVKDGMCVMPPSAATPKQAARNTAGNTRSKTPDNDGTPGTMKQKRICIVYKPGHEGDDRYCSQSVPAPK